MMKRLIVAIRAAWFIWKSTDECCDITICVGRFIENADREEHELSLYLHPKETK